MTRRLLIAALLFSAACSPHARPVATPDLLLTPAESEARPLSRLLAQAPLTVLVFFSATCPCQTAHDPVLRDLYTRYHERGVAFFAVASEVGVTRADLLREARARAYPYPILLDEDARLADALGAEFATYAIVADRGGKILYRGGIDSNKQQASPDATPWLANALDDILANKTPRAPETKALGCALRTW